VAVEPDERLAGYLVQRVRAEGGSVDVRVGAFEEVELPAASFDLVVSATAFHWLDQPVALAKVGRVLRPGGWLANWWTQFGDSFGLDAFHEATKHVMLPLGKPAANPDGRPSGASGLALPFPLDAEARLADLRTAGVFDEIDHEIIPWLARFDTGQVRALYATFPNVSGLPEPRRTEVLDTLATIAEREFGGMVERTFYTAIYTARRR
jgi:ubiquinone/menaquinone biosynthesis C-methylase UbiE